MSRDREPVKVNKILSRKASIAGIPADVFGFVIAIDLVLYLFLCQMFGVSLVHFGVVCIVIDGTWVVLTLRGVWRFVGLAFRPPRYFRANLRYRSPLNSPHGSLQPQAKKASRRRHRR
jgi:hypothetical protein